MVSIASPKGIALRVLATLQHKLVTLVRCMLVAHPTVEKHRSKNMFIGYIGLQKKKMCHIG